MLEKINIETKLSNLLNFIQSQPWLIRQLITSFEKKKKLQEPNKLTQLEVH